MSVKTAGRLLRQRRFLPLFVLFQTGTFNDNALKQALIGLVTYAGVVIFAGVEREAVVPLAALLFTLPFLLICAIAGQIADKVDRGVILERVKRVEVGLMLLAATGFLVESAPILCVALVGMGAQSAFFSPTKNAVLPQWMRDDELITANGLMSGFQFFSLLLGQVAGLILVLMAFPDGSVVTGPRIVAALLVTLALVGWLAAERVPDAPAPQPSLRVDYNPLTAIWRVLVFAWRDQSVFRPLAGIAWFYGLSTVFVTAFPVYVADVMGYDQNVLTFILALSTIAILVGSLLCVVLARGREAHGVLTAGIIGVTLFSFDLWLGDHASGHAAGERGDLADFLADPDAVRFLVDSLGASLCNGLFVVPLQAMAQRRADPERRAQLMSAGAVLLNFAVNAVTALLILFGTLRLPSDFPFLLVSLGSAAVSVYAVRRWLEVRRGLPA